MTHAAIPDGEVEIRKRPDFAKMMKRADGEWICNRCGGVLDNSQAIRCDWCRLPILDANAAARLTALEAECDAQQRIIQAMSGAAERAQILVNKREAENAALKAARNKRAPVQGYVAGIPWEMHLRAYDGYCKRHGGQKALIEGGCRGGFNTGELDHFIPGWREELSDRKAMQDEIAAFKAEVAGLRAKAIEDAAKECNAEAELAVEAIRRQELAGEHGGVGHEQTIGWEQGARRCAGRIRSLSTSQGESSGPR